MSQPYRGVTPFDARCRPWSTDWVPTTPHRVQLSVVGPSLSQ